MTITTIWLGLPPATQHAGGHAHTCPDCYQDEACNDTCSCFPDMEREDGTPRGAFVTCSTCQKSDAFFAPPQSAQDAAPSPTRVRDHAKT